MYHFDNLAEAEAALAPFWPPRLRQSRIAYTLEHVTAFMAYIGNPQDAIQAIHIAGTSGKTSTAYYSAALLKAAGKKAGLLTSPHIEQLNERVQIDLVPLPEQEFCTELALFMDLVAKSHISLTYAEILYAFAYWEFARQDLDYIVVETGLGGLLDVTNVISRADKLCIITDIGLDHVNVLGKTIAEIAAQKAGIIQEHNAVVCYDQGPTVLQAITSACQRRQADLQVIAPELHEDRQFLPLFQQRNFGLASAAVKILLKQKNIVLSADQILTAARVYIPGRMEVLRSGNKTIILDGAHNSQKVQALRQSVTASYPAQSIALLVAFTARRELAPLLAEVASFDAHVIVTEGPRNDGHEWHSAATGADAARQAGIQSVEAIPEYHQAFAALLQRPEKLLVATGSLYLYHYLRPLVV